MDWRVGAALAAIVLLSITAAARAGERFTVGTADALPLLMQDQSLTFGAKLGFPQASLRRQQFDLPLSGNGFGLRRNDRWQTVAALDLSNFDRLPIANLGAPLPVPPVSPGGIRFTGEVGPGAELPRSSFERWSLAASAVTHPIVPRYLEVSPLDTSLTFTLRGSASPALALGGRGVAGVIWGMLPRP